jgi:very-short-patch-repair endonuclease
MQRRAAELRHNTTPAEQKLWSTLRAHQTNDVHFRRQHAIGNYIVDFCSPRQKLVIELDGTPFGRSTWNKKTTISSAPNSCNPKATGYCAFGIARFSQI